MYPPEVLPRRYDSVSERPTTPMDPTKPSPKITPGGGPTYFNPHKPGNINVVDMSDPHHPRSVSVDLRNLTKEDTAELTDNGKLISEAADVESMYANAYDVFTKFAERAANRVNGRAAHIEPVRVEAQPQPIGRENPVPAASQPGSNWPSKSYQFEPPTSRAPAQAPPVVSDVVQPPEKQVLFDIQGAGPMEAYYHEVTVNGDLILLAYDRRFRGPKWMPPNLIDDTCPHCGHTWPATVQERQREAVCPRCNASSAPGRPTNERYLLVDIPECPEVFKVKSIGLTLPFRNFDLCILPIERSAPKDQ